MIQAGDAFPSGKLILATPDGPRETTTEEMFNGRTVVLFAVPGAFTPTCSARHLPGYLEHADALTEKGVDAVACLAVNDPFVLAAWARDQGVEGRVQMVSDGNGTLVRSLGMDQDMTARGFGVRAKRFAAVVVNGVVKSIHVEEPGLFEVSKAESILALL